MQLNTHTANLISNTDAVCVFVNDRVDADVINILAQKSKSYCATLCRLQ